MTNTERKVIVKALELFIAFAPDRLWWHKAANKH
jgi:hypothetical protein